MLIHGSCLHDENKQYMDKNSCIAEDNRQVTDNNFTSTVQTKQIKIERKKLKKNGHPQEAVLLRVSDKI